MVKFFGAVLWGALACGWGSADAAEKKTDKYHIEAMVTPGGIKAGQAGRYAVKITPGPGLVLKTDTPFKAALTAADGVVLGAKELSAKDFVDPKAAVKSVQTVISAKKAGKYQVDAALTFFLCTAELCQRYKDTVTVSFEVK